MESDAGDLDVERYNRQIILPAFGLRAQRALRDASAMLVGCGGLGCPAAMYLAGAGVGRLVLVDNGDAVETSNLHRQIGHATTRVGMDKTQSLRCALQALNPTVTVDTVSTGLHPTNAHELVRMCDVVLDCTDNVTSRYLANDACVLEGRPLVSGSAIGLEGQLAVYVNGARRSAEESDAPCYRCVFPEPPPPNCVGSCDSAGVLGPVPGVIGTLQALEAIKLLTRFRWSAPLVGKMLMFDGAESRFRTVQLRKRNRSCLVCGDCCEERERIRRTDRYDYRAFVGGTAPVEVLSKEFRLSAAEFEGYREDRPAHRVVDVRASEHFAIAHVKGAVNVPVGELASRLDELRGIAAEYGEVIVMCRRGNDSQKAVRELHSQGLRARDVEGGFEGWTQRER